MSREVGQPGDWWLASDGGVDTVLIVVVQPSGQGGVALVGCVVDLIWARVGRYPENSIEVGHGYRPGPGGRGGRDMVCPPARVRRPEVNP